MSQIFIRVALAVLLLALFTQFPVSGTKCPKPANPQNGKVRIFARGRRTFARYLCSNGYKMTGFGSRLCNSKTGKWGGKEPLCVKSSVIRSCEQPDRIRNGAKSVTSLDIGGNVTYSCKTGYVLHGKANRKCLPNGKWSGKKPYCGKARRCKDPGVPQHGRRLGNKFYADTMVRFLCDDGYEVTGSAELVCLRTGQWNAQKPKCTKIDPLRGLKEVAANLRQNFLDKYALMTTDSRARSGLSSGAAGLDLVFIFDSSASVGTHNFRKGIDFAKVILDEFGISDSPSGTRVAVVVFSSDAQVIYNLQTNKMPSKEEGIKKLENLPFQAGGTATSKALEVTLHEICPETRNNSRKALFLITDGRSNTGLQPKDNAQLLRESCHFEIYAIGVTDSVDKTELESIASEPFRTHVHLLEDFQSLAKLKDLITAKGTDHSECGKAGETQFRSDKGHMIRVVAGNEAKPGAWPWQAAIYVKGSFKCSGVVINENWTLTLAHCVYYSGKLKARDILVRLGEHDRALQEGSEQSIRVKKRFKHPQARQHLIGSDLALLKLQRPAKLTPFAKSVCLPLGTDKRLVRPTKFGVVTGWGSTQNSPGNSVGPPYAVLQQIQVPFASSRECRVNASSPGQINSLAICAGVPTAEIDDCKGDRGSPLVIKRKTGEKSWALVGLSSWTEGCATKGKYGVYTSIMLDEHLEWITKKTGQTPS